MNSNCKAQLGYTKTWERIEAIYYSLAWCITETHYYYYLLSLLLLLLEVIQTTFAHPGAFAVTFSSWHTYWELSFAELFGRKFVKVDSFSAIDVTVIFTPRVGVDIRPIYRHRKPVRLIQPSFAKFTNSNAHEHGILFYRVWQSNLFIYFRASYSPRTWAADLGRETLMPNFAS